MIREIHKIRAEGTAYRITQDYCLDKPAPVPVEDIAMDRGVLCLEAKLTGCLARLVRKGKRGIIRTHSGIREEGRKRFAIAHEMGHWFLHEAESQIFVCTAEQMRDYKGSPMEVEANLFASELLMPTALFRPLACDVEPRLERVKSLAGTFKTSLTATGMKFVDINKHECILVLSTNKAVADGRSSRANALACELRRGCGYIQNPWPFMPPNPLASWGQTSSSQRRGSPIIRMTVKLKSRNKVGRWMVTTRC